MIEPGEVHDLHMDTGEFANSVLIQFLNAEFPHYWVEIGKDIRKMTFFCEA